MISKYMNHLVILGCCVSSWVCAQGNPQNSYYQNPQYPQSYNDPYQGRNYPGQYQVGYRTYDGYQGGDYNQNRNYQRPYQSQYNDAPGSYQGANYPASPSPFGSNIAWGDSDNKDQKVPDNVISTRVMENLMNTPYLSPGARNIQATAKDGKVTLKGRVANSNEKNMIEYMVKNVVGVKSVSNDLETEK